MLWQSSFSLSWFTSIFIINNLVYVQPSPSHSYFDNVSTQCSLSVGSSYDGVVNNSASNASLGVSAGVSAIDTGMKAGLALAGVLDASLESAYIPALAGLGIKGHGMPSHQQTVRPRFRA